MVLIEPATKNDLDDVIRIARDNLTECYDDALFFTMLDLAGDTFLVARDPLTADVAAFALAVRQTPYEARLIVIAVDAGYQGRNVGQRLLREIERRMRTRGVMEISLEAREENTRAISFYRRAGYDIAAGVPSYYSDGARAIVLRKAI